MGLFSRNKRPLGDYEWNIDEDGTLTITGSGLTSDKSPWCDRSKEVRRLIVKGTGVSYWVRIRSVLASIISKRSISTRTSSASRSLHS